MFAKPGRFCQPGGLRHAQRVNHVKEFVLSKDAAHHRAIAAQMDLHLEYFAENFLKHFRNIP